MSPIALLSWLTVFCGAAVGAVELGLKIGMMI